MKRGRRKGQKGRGNKVTIDLRIPKELKELAEDIAHQDELIMDFI